MEIKESTLHDGGSRQDITVLSNVSIASSQTPATQDVVESQEDVWGRCIHTNNVGMDHLMHGRLSEARSLFFEAITLHLHASQHPTFDPDVREYESNWVDLRSIIDSITTDVEPRRTMSHIFMFGLKIGVELASSDEEDDTTGGSHAASKTKSDRLDILRTTRIDWAISYNLGLVAQLLGVVTADVWGMIYRADSIDRYEKLMFDVVDWHDGQAPLDVAVLLLALRNNQGSMYRQLQVGYKMEAHWSRMRSIIHASRPLRSHPICQIFLQNIDFLVREQRPAAAA